MPINPANQRMMDMLAHSELHSYRKHAKATSKQSSHFLISATVEKILNATTVEGLHDILVDIRDHFGFDFFSFFVYLPGQGKQPLSYLLMDYRLDWLDHYIEQNYFSHDPTISHVLTSSTPILIDASKHYDHLTDEESEVKNRAYDFGYRKISCFPVHGVNGDYGSVIFVHLNNGQSVGEKNESVITAFPDVYLLCSYIYEALTRILRADYKSVIANPLSPREQEILRWIAEGKSSKVISDKMMISENTVLFHIKNIHRKMGVKTRQHAVAKALNQKIITL